VRGVKPWVPIRVFSRAEVSLSEVDDLDELQLVTAREFRRGYQAQVNGELVRLRYAKILRTPDGHVLVYRPSIGNEHLKQFLWGLPRALGMFFLVAWQVTVVAILGLFVLLASLFH
jgi:hypothetical protein